MNVVAVNKCQFDGNGLDLAVRATLLDLTFSSGGPGFYSDPMDRHEELRLSS